MPVPWPASTLPETEAAWANDMVELGPQIMVRPANMEVYADHYPVLLAAAAGCHVLADERLRHSRPAWGRCGCKNRLAAWKEALSGAIADLTGTLERGRQSAVRQRWPCPRARMLCHPGLDFSAGTPELRSAAE